MEPIKLLPVYLRLELAALRLRHAVAQCVEIIRIPLHHVPTLGQILGFVAVSYTHLTLPTKRIV